MSDEELPRDAKLVQSILMSMGVQHHEPRVVNQLLDFWYRYVVEILSDAQVYSEHAGKSAIDCDDVKLAVQTKVNSSFSQPPPRETLLELARARNSIPLPKAVGGPGIALPPDQDTLLSPNWQLFVPTRLVQKQEEEMDIDQEEESKFDQSRATRESQPSPLHKSEQDGVRRVSFALASKRPKA
ncbi:hypothetical protein O6H91_09G119900 [Diphasiastrum complanatum]|uniref:Uncharacterized protein n=1 Tax=Diphasiastrum complanatum TaxID=34168 RepID=A0ACC2CU69_DIPCM|nr:hypothetical protein O6H91_09G119900 [Diphasiastrum complanatum]